MKKMKKLASLFLTMVMVLSMTIVAFAAETTNNATAKGDGDFSITLNGKATGHTYTAYQIFKGDLLEKNVVTGEETKDENKVLSNIEWGEHVNATTELINALQGITLDGNRTPFATLDSSKPAEAASKVAEILQGNKEDSEIAREFAKVIGDNKYLKASDKTSQEGSKTEEIVPYTIDYLNAGYYLVKDTGDVGSDDAYTRYIMEVVSSVTATVKAEIPTVEKKIVDGVNEDDSLKLVDSNTAGVGQTVTYEISGEVPDHTDYETYFYVINDTLSDGLTFNNDITVTVGGTPLTLDTDYAVYTKDTSIKVDPPHTFEIAFKNIKAYEKGSKIVVHYSATVNDKAVIGGTGNPNEVNLKYSNNPNSDENGENPNKPGTPDSKVPTGESPKDKTITYVAEIIINKTFDGDVLPKGAEFTLTGKSNQLVLAKKEYYDLATETEINDTSVTKYWLLKTGKYSTETPRFEQKDAEGNITDRGNIDSYVSTKDQYVKKEQTTTSVVEKDVKMVAITNEEGKIIFKGLGAGNFTIEETFVPAGYNKAENITVNIGCELPTEVSLDETADNNAKWSIKDGTSANVKLNGATVDVPNSGSGEYEMTIDNKSGALLPSTGGIGTTIFYAVGIILMAGAVFFVVRKRRA